MATLIGRSGAGDDLIRKLHDMGVSRSCTTIKQVMERRDAIDRIIALERERQERLLEREMKMLRSGMKKYKLLDSLLFFSKNKKSEEYLKRIDHLQANRDAIIENSLLYLYREKDILDRLTREYRSELKGYYGELLVLDTLERLSDDYYVLSDVRITREFGHKFDGKMLKSARVDHVVVGRKGVYCIETKNWNLKWKNEDRPTPGEQARRASYLLYRYLKYTCNIPGVRVMSIVLYTNTTVKGKEDFVRFLRYEDFPAYLEARQEILSDDDVKKIVECLKDRDIRFDDTLPEKEDEREDAAADLKLVENASGGETT
ncbi:Nuclease-related domain protein [Methanocella conradii HZ254]|uniref:Nuclease-related domain protein n=1 Tax=Methanocella conradii (strain DSM 24694 / JCM 17849 / CGMCC 1.5162 / HZ254) TaxID=1041930 RepID=H8I6V8_METCZ|nr:nuclease-related domain-containing protein [Methanocella conradii]AFC99428.1 Nuclease-related domain protein [Methanocella conradii HZ254]MDI6897984.1 nuclease-related domain-containing protein [Methanocella conradii]